MLKLKIISLFLSLLMTLQMLPLAQIGSMLSSNQWTEELPHGHENNIGKPDQAKFTEGLPPYQHQLAANFYNSKAAIFKHFSATIPFNHSTDVVTPPPNFNA